VGGQGGETDRVVNRMCDAVKVRRQSHPDRVRMRTRTTPCAHRVLTPPMLIHLTSYRIQVCQGLSERQGRTSLQQRARAAEQHERPHTKILMYLNNKIELMLALPSYEMVAEIFR